MSKTKEELDALKEDVEAVNEKLQELTPEELEQVCGGFDKEFRSKKSQWILGGYGYVEDNIRPAELRFN